ncbi:MAG: asparagine synthase-related protein [Oscillospiraceae bacterium]|nr:asparagine synthase-related protein [Oscillospiraceae bacterium]
MPLFFQDRKNNKKQLRSFTGETIAEILRRNRIPVSSVITICDGKPISENSKLDDRKIYLSKLIEGYDIESVIETVDNKSKEKASYFKDRITFGIDGKLIGEHVSLSCDEVVQLVDENIKFAVTHYGMIKSSDKVLVGLSGGVDSSSLLISLEKLSKIIGFTIEAATFEDFDSLSSPTFSNAKSLAKELGVNHHLINADIVDKAFNLTKPIREILPELMKTEDKHFAMYIDHHTTRRALELFSEQIGANKIILGLHVTDLVAGLLNSFTTGYYVADMFDRKIGPYTYIYPLMFIPKKELHLYYYAHMGEYAVHSYPNAWELDPKDRNYYYYLADLLQDSFPGIENYLFEANSWRLKRHPSLNYTQCCNCKSHILQQEFVMANKEMCDVCASLDKLGYIK